MGQTIFCLFCVSLPSFEKCVTNFLGAEKCFGINSCNTSRHQKDKYVGRKGSRI